MLLFPGASRFAAYHTRSFPRIFVYHRFSRFGSASTVSATAFAWQLDQFLKRKCSVLSLARYIEARQQNRGLENVVILTIDDGYRDFYEIAYPELKRRGMAATFFVTTDFIEGKIWLWPDRVRYILENANFDQEYFSLGDTVIPLELDNSEGIDNSWDKIVQYCIKISDAERKDLLARLEKQCQVQLPEIPPEKFAPATWQQLREMAENSIEIGSHTRSHPILSKIDPELLVAEIATPKQLLEERLQKPVETFCYPNSRPGDINEDVVTAVKKAGYSGAVFGTDPTVQDLYLLPRMAVSDDRLDFLWKLNGFETLISHCRMVEKKK